MKKYFAALLILLFFAWPSFAADLNGYTAQYECRAGGAHCDVDVVSLSQRECDQKISASTAWSSINWSSNTICIEAGDHTSKGTLTIPSSASGCSPTIPRCTGISRADLCERRHPCGAPTVNSTLPLQDKAWYRNLPSLPLRGITSSFSYVNWNQQQESS